MKHLFSTLMVCFLVTGIAFACPPDGAKAEAKISNAAGEAAQSADVQFASLDLSVKGMTCAGCENKVKAALTGIDGVVETKKVCAQSNSATLTYDPSVVSEAQIMAALKEKTGYAIAIVKSAGMTEADAAKHACSAECKKECCAGKASKSSCEKSKATGKTNLEKE